MVSIIIRTRNEERWITSCLRGVYDQSYKDFEVIIVDNESNDRTLEKARRFPVSKIVSCNDYFPGKALNIGIKASRGELIVCLSGHCIPVNESWLKNLVRNIGDSSVAGVYGRQEPMSFSSDGDKRDLLLIFGLDRKVQIKDSFFHNANSIIRRDLWQKNPFDEKVTNIEDRIWAQQMLDSGYKFVYEPEASVYHYHGIHQESNQERLTNVMRIIEEKCVDMSRNGTIDGNKLKVVAIIPVSRHCKRKSAEALLINGVEQYFYTIKSAEKSKYIDEVIVSTDDEEVTKFAEEFGAKCPFIRPNNLSKGWINLEMVQKYSLENLENQGIYPDILVHLEETFPFRDPELIDEMIEYLLKEGHDSVIAVRQESGFLWQEDGLGKYVRLDSGDLPREFKEKLFIGLRGLCCVTHPEFVRRERLLGDKIGLYKVMSPLAGFEVRDKRSREIAGNLMQIREQAKAQ